MTAQRIAAVRFVTNMQPKDPRIKVIHKGNGGAPSARNVAIDQATGKYLYFMDSDDWAESTMLEDMVTAAEKNSSQFVVTGFYIDTYYTDSGTNSYRSRRNKDCAYPTQQAFRGDGSPIICLI